jgi:hypothetical protein
MLFGFGVAIVLYEAVGIPLMLRAKERELSVLGQGLTRQKSNKAQVYEEFKERGFYTYDTDDAMVGRAPTVYVSATLLMSSQVELVIQFKEGVATSWNTRQLHDGP